MSVVTEGNVISRPGLIGWGEDLPSETSLSELGSTECIAHISSGFFHSAAVCMLGHVYTLGRSNHHGWMKKVAINEPTIVSDLVSYAITHTACGHDCTFFVTDQGQLFSSGWRTNGPSPVLVRGLPRVKKVAAGGSLAAHTVLLTEGGEVWVCGRNDNGQLGLGHYNNTCKFTRVFYLTDPIIDISCGGHFTALLTASGDLMMAGWNNYHQLGLAYVQKTSRFQSVFLPFTAIAAVACGFHHTTALAVDGTVWVWGSNSYGQLGIGKAVKKSLPTRVKGLEGYTISSVFAGCGHTAFVARQGDVFVCGRGQSGELGQGRADIFIPTLLKKSPGLRVKQVVFGGKYSLLNVTQEPRASPLKLTPITQTDDEASNCITDLDRILMKTLECPVCLKTMRAPIRQCYNGHSLCGRCFSSYAVQTCPTCRGQLMSTRNISLEYLSSQIQLPCLDCMTRIPMTRLDSHDDECPYRLTRCPVELSCGWNGSFKGMFNHLYSDHPEMTWQNLPHTFNHNLQDRQPHTDLLVMGGEYFVLHRQTKRNKAHFTVKYVGPPENTARYKFRMVVNVNSNEWNQIITNIMGSLALDIEVLLHTPEFWFRRKGGVECLLYNSIVPCQVTINKTDKI